MRKYRILKERPVTSAQVHLLSMRLLVAGGYEINVPREIYYGLVKTPSKDDEVALRKAGDEIEAKFYRDNEIISQCLLSQNCVPSRLIA